MSNNKVNSLRGGGASLKSIILLSGLHFGLSFANLGPWEQTAQAVVGDHLAAKRSK